MPRLDQRQREAVRVQLAGLKGGELAGRVRSLAADLGVHPATLYRLTGEYRLRRAGRKGPQAAGLAQEAYRVVAGLVALGGSAVRGLELARANGMTNGHPPSLSAVRARLRAEGVSAREVRDARALKPRRRFEAARPNDMHQIDFTVAPQFYIDPQGAPGFEGPLQRSKNHPGNKLPRLWLYALLDDRSRAGYARFYPYQPNQWTVPDFLFHAWADKTPEDSGFVLHGMPRRLYCDRDPAMTSKLFLRAMERLGVEVLFHLPGEPQAKGKVERFIRTLLADEVITRVARFKDLATANAYLGEFLLHYNYKPHGGTGEVPFRRWREIRPGELRLAPREELREVLMLRSFERKVPADLRLSVEGALIQLPFRHPWINLVGSRVEVLVGPSMRGHVLVAAMGELHEVPAAPPAVLPAGEFRAVAKTRRQAALEEAEAADFSGIRTWGFADGALGARSEGRVERPAPALPARGGEAFDEGRLAGHPALEAGLDLLDALAALQALGAVGSPASPGERALVEAAFAGRDRIPREELARVAAEAERGERTGTQ